MLIILRNALGSEREYRSEIVVHMDEIVLRCQNYSTLQTNLAETQFKVLICGKSFTLFIYLGEICAMFA